MLSTPNLMLLSNDKNEVYYMQEILGGYATLAHARDRKEMFYLLDGQPCDALLCGWPFYQHEWRGEMQEIREQYPDLPVIELSGTDATQQWMEVTNGGAFDLLALPSPKPEMLPDLEDAPVSHEAQKTHRRAAADPVALLAS